jgi:hypothetical protein
LSHRGYEASTLTYQPSRVSLQSRNTGDRNKVLAPEFSHALELLGDQIDLSALGSDLLQETLDFLLVLSNPFNELRLLALACVSPDYEQALFAAEHHGNVGLMGASQKMGRKGNFARPIAFSLVSGLPCEQLDQSFVNDREIGPGHRFVETDEQIACTDVITLPDLEISYDATRRVLNLLHT